VNLSQKNQREAPVKKTKKQDALAKLRHHYEEEYTQLKHEYQALKAKYVQSQKNFDIINEHNESLQADLKERNLKVD